MGKHGGRADEKERGRYMDISRNAEVEGDKRIKEVKGSE